MVTKKEIDIKINYLKGKIGSYIILSNFKSSFSILSDTNIYLDLALNFLKGKIEINIFNRNKNKKYNTFFIEYTTKKQKEYIINSFLRGGLKWLKQKRLAKWRSFGARHYASYKVNPTKKRRYALKNWEFAIPKNPSERDNF